MAQPELDKNKLAEIFLRKLPKNAELIQLGQIRDPGALAKIIEDVVVQPAKTKRFENSLTRVHLDVGLVDMICTEEINKRIKSFYDLVMSSSHGQEDAVVFLSFMTNHAGNGHMSLHQRVRS